MRRGNTAQVAIGFPWKQGVPKPPGWAIPVLVGSILGQIIWDYVSQPSEEGGGYDWTGWSTVHVCEPPTGMPRRWSESLSGSCIANQAVNYPTIRPQDNYAAICLTYENAFEVLRLRNQVNFARDVPGLLLPWEVNGSAGAFPPVLPARPAIRMPASLPHYATLQDVLPLSVAHPLPLPIGIPGLRPEIWPFPGDQWDARRYNLPIARGRTVLGTEVVITPGVKPVTQTGAASAPPDKKTRERKIKSFVPRLAIRALNTITEAVDFINAIHDALPKECKAKPVSLAPRGFQARTVFGDVVRDQRTLGERWSGKANLPGWKVHTSMANNPEFEARFKPRKVKEVLTDSRGKAILDREGKKQWVFKGKLNHVRNYRAPSVPEKLRAIYNCMGHLEGDAETRFLVAALKNLAVEALEDAAYGAFSQAIARATPKQYKRPFGPEAGLAFWPGL